MVAFKTSFERALNRMTGGLFGWMTNQAEVDHWMTADRALSYAPVWNCVSTISGAFMIMPLNTLRKSGKTITEQPKHSSYQLLRWRPNAYQTPSAFKRQMMCHALLWGNARAYIRRDGRRPVELVPLLPDRTVTLLVDGEKYHATMIEPNDRLSIWENLEATPEKMIILPDADVWHVPGLGYNGIEGKSLITLARQSWGIGLGAEKHVASQQKKGYAGGLMLEAPAGSFRDEGKAKEFLENFKKNHKGPEKAGEIGLLREGITAKVLAMNNTDAQFIEQRRFQREDAALWFLLQGILGDSSGNSYASLEQKNLAYRTNCLAPWTTAMEEECDLKLLNESERTRGFYHKFNDGALLRTEKSATMAFISQGIAARVLSPNEGRNMLDMNPYDGGDTYENPAISPGVTDNDGDDVEDPTESKANQARIAHLIGVEAGKVEEAAKQATEKGKNFLQWVDDFYDNKWQTKLSSCFEELGIDVTEAAVHCEESRRRLIEICDYSTRENLVENVSKCVSTWKTRSNLIGKMANV